MSADIREQPSAEASASDKDAWPSQKRSAIALIQDTFNTYPHEKIGVSFNAGKDSVVMLELIREAMTVDALQKCVIFFLDTGDDFEDMTNFRCQFERERLPGITVHRIPSGKGLCDGLWTVKNTFGIDAVLMGTRHADPSGKYQRGACAMTTDGWPPMMRVCPIFSWNVTDVWRFTIEQSLPYCRLYLRGFTSLGGSHVTLPNAALRQEDGTFAPAWTLKNIEEERSGRIVSGHPPPSATGCLL